MEGTYASKPFDLIEMENNVLQIRSLGRIFLLRFEDEHGVGEFRKLMSLMDGTRDLAALSRQIDLTRDELEVMVNQIREYDLLEPVAPGVLAEVPEDYRNTHEEVFRIFDLSSYTRGKSECIRTVYRSSVTVVGDNPLSREILVRLIGYGFRQLTVVRLASRGQAPADPPAGKALDPSVSLRAASFPEAGSIDPELLGDFTIAPLVGGDEEYYEALNEICVKNSKSWIPVFVEPTKGYIGPAVIPFKTACYRCLELRLVSGMENLAAYTAYREHKKKRSGEIFALRSNLETTANFFMAEFYKLVTRYQYAATYNHVIEISFYDNAVSVPAVLKFPRCPVCSRKTKMIPYDNYAYHMFLDKLKNGAAAGEAR